MIFEKKYILKVGLTNATKESILEFIIEHIQKYPEKFYIVTPNPEIIVYAVRHEEFRQILNQAKIALPDGVGDILAGRILGEQLQERVTGIDLLEEICARASEENLRQSKKPITVGFLGGKGNVAEKAADCLRKKYPGLEVVFAGSEWSKEGFNFMNHESGIMNHEYESKKTRKEAITQNTKYKIQNAEQVDLLFVAFGFPKQEYFMSEHLGKIPVKVMMGVGGAFDTISGKVSRAPVLLRNIGFEWLYRLIAQPWRIKRQLALGEFIYLILKEKLSTIHPARLR